jgi:hypothetical protein
MHFAYIDPGAGSMIVQAIIAAIVSVPFFFRRSFASVVRRVRGTRDEVPAESTTGESEG